MRSRLDELGPDLDVVLVTTSAANATVVLDDQDELVSPDAVGPRWEQGAEGPLAELASNGAQVAVLRDTPKAPENVPACLSEVAPTDWQACSFSVGSSREMDETLVGAEVAAGRAAGIDVRVADPVPLMCPDGTCPVVAANGAVVYIDRDHFTDTFSRSAAPLLAEQLDSLDLPVLDGS